MTDDSNSRAHMRHSASTEMKAVPRPEMYRSIIDVVNIDETNVEVYVSGWDPSRNIKVAIKQISDPNHLLTVDRSYLGMVNLGVEQEHELQITLLAIAPEPDPADGLA